MSIIKTSIIKPLNNKTSTATERQKITKLRITKRRITKHRKYKTLTATKRRKYKTSTATKIRK